MTRYECHHCGTELPPGDDERCPRCGAYLPPPPDDSRPLLVPFLVLAVACGGAGFAARGWPGMAGGVFAAWPLALAANAVRDELL